MSLDVQTGEEVLSIVHGCFIKLTQDTSIFYKSGMNACQAMSECLVRLVFSFEICYDLDRVEANI